MQRNIIQLKDHIPPLDALTIGQSLHLFDQEPIRYLQALLLRRRQVRQGHAQDVHMRLGRRLAHGMRLRRLLFRQHADLDADIQHMSFAPDLDVGNAARPGGTDEALQVGGRNDDMAIIAKDHVRGLQPGFCRRAGRIHIGNQGALRLAQAKGIRQPLGYVLDGNAQAAAYDVPGGAQLLRDIERHIDGDGKGQAHIATGA